MIIPLEGVVANAFIELRKKRKEEDELLFEQMDAYRRKIIDLLAQKKEEIAAIPCSGKDVSDFLDEYSDLFELNERDKKWYIHLKGDKESIDKKLMDFNACLPLKFLAIVSDSESKEPLLQTLSA
jgi:hypothetical protein